MEPKKSQTYEDFLALKENGAIPADVEWGANPEKVKKRRPRGKTHPNNVHGAIATMKVPTEPHVHYVEPFPAPHGDFHTALESCLLDPPFKDADPTPTEEEEQAAEEKVREHAEQCDWCQNHEEILAREAKEAQERKEMFDRMDREYREMPYLETRRRDGL